MVEPVLIDRDLGTIFVCDVISVNPHSDELSFFPARDNYVSAVNLISPRRRRAQSERSWLARRKSNREVTREELP